MDTTEETPIALMTVTDDSIPLLNLNGVLVTFKADPLADKAWAELTGLGPKLNAVDQSDAKEIAGVVADLKRIMGHFVVTGKEEWDRSKSLGLINLVKIMNTYVKEVTDGIPT